MGMFKVGRGKGGSRQMTQIATPEEAALQRAENPTPLDEAIEGLPKKKIGLERPGKSAHVGSSAYRALANGLHKQSVKWALKFIEKLDDIEDLEKVRKIETSHPKHETGRITIIKAIDTRRDELEEKNFTDPKDKRPPEDKEFPCEHCEFKAGSEEGLTAHVDAVHDL